MTSKKNMEKRKSPFRQKKKKKTYKEKNVKTKLKNKKKKKPLVGFLRVPRGVVLYNKSEKKILSSFRL